ncbi:MAG: hypothetical protein JF587_19495 [Catenulisporales bacterium]|jgi:hypothetical protein|nr:hypothetical protein [Catenulisporales bacterium]
MEVSGAALAGVSVFVVLAGMVGVVGLVLAGYTDVSGGRGRMLLLCGLGAAGVVVGLVGTMISGDTVRVGGSGPSLKDAGDSVSSGGSAGFALPWGAVLALVLLTALLAVAVTVLRRPLGVGVAAGGWLFVVAGLMFGLGDKGDLILANTTSSQIFVYGGLVIAFGVGVLGYQRQLTDRLTQAQAARERVH